MQINRSNISVCNFIDFGTEIVNSAVDKMLSITIPYYSLNKEIQSLRGRVTINPLYALAPAEKKLLEEAFLKGNRLFGEKLLKSLTQIPVEDLREAIFSCLDNPNQEKQIQASLLHFLQLLDSNGLEEWIGLDSDEISNRMQTQALLKDHVIDKAFLVKLKAVWTELSREVNYFIHRLIDTLINVTGLSELFEEEEEGGRFYGSKNTGRYEAQSKIELYLLLLGYPSLIFSSLFVALGSAPIAMVLTGIAVVATLISIPIYMRYGKLCPKAVKGLNNLNQEILEGKDPPTFIRRDVINRILNAFSAGKGVLLTAAPGSGKTTVVRSLAELIVANKCKQVASNAQLFSMNANKLNGSSVVELDELEKIFKRHSKEFILFLDEIESIFIEGKLFGKASDSLLTFHDRFPFVICATTTDQFDTTIQRQDAFNRRFVRIEINPLEENELTIALYELLRFMAPKLYVDDDAIPYVIEKWQAFNNKTSQADAACALLKAAIVKATHISFTQLNTEISALEATITSFNNQYFCSSAASAEEIQNQKAARQNLEEKKAELQQKQKEWKRLEKIEKQTLKLKQSSYQIAAQAIENDDLTDRNWLIKQAQYQTLSLFVQQKRQEFGLPTGINKELIDTIIQDANV